MAKKTTLGLSVKKSDDVNAWFTEVISKAELIEYTDVSGCYIIRPWAWRMWECVQEYVGAYLKKSGVNNAAFPLFIPENLLTKEKNHVEGFAPEVAWVTEHGSTAGSTKMKERLAVRPTSETIMYEAYKKWIRSHRDLPLRLNQWNSVVRWEFKNPQPFLRSREFWWNEGHSVFARKEEADTEVREMIELYAKTYEELMAIPSLLGKKSEKEKFAGADYTLSAEVFLPIGKAIQGTTSHGLGQNFAKAFDISFLDENGEKQLPWQNSWAITTRSLGVLILMHGDDKGLVLPPKIAPQQIVVVPITFGKKNAELLDHAKRLVSMLSKQYRIEFDDRSEVSPGFKFNHWELKGVPLRLEIGPRDLAHKQVVLVRRDTGEKKIVSLSDIKRTVSQVLDEMQDSLFKNAKKFLKESIVKVKTMAELEKAVKNGKIAFAQWSGSPEAEELIKDKTAAKSLNSPFKQPKVSGKCITGEGKATVWSYFAKSL